MLGEIQNHEIPKNVRSIATEKKIDPARIFEILENALLKALVCVYGKARMAVEVNQDSGVINIMESRIILPDDKYNPESDIIYENQDNEDSSNSENEKPFHYRSISLTDAKKLNANASINSMINISIPGAWNNIKKTKNFIKTFNIDFSKNLNFLIREQEYSHFIKKQGTIITAVVRRFSRDGYILTYDNYEILLPSNPKSTYEKETKSYFRSETILNEKFGTDDSVNIYVKSVVNDPNSKYQIIASRTHPSFLGELLKQNVPEIRDELIIINKIVRIPGLRAKVVVHSTDKNLDPIGACIGIRGIRIKTISQELKGEKIDVIEYSDNLENMVQNAIKPVKPVRIITDEHNKKITVVVPNKEISNAIGKSGINTKLLSSLMNCKVAMISEEIDDIEKKNEFTRIVSEFEKALDVEELIAQLLVVAGYKSVKSIANSTIQDLMKIEHFNEELVEELKERANSYLKTSINEKISTIDKEYLEFINSFNKNQSMLLLLIDNNIKTIQDFADLDIYELQDIIAIDEENSYNEDELSDMLIKARKIIINSSN